MVRDFGITHRTIPLWLQESLKAGCKVMLSDSFAFAGGTMLYSNPHMLTSLQQNASSPVASHKTGG